MRLYYVRHGEPTYTPDSLTPLGRRQAEAISRRMALKGLDRIYASTSTRAQMTAQPTAEILKKDVVLLDWAHETRAWAQMSVEIEPERREWACCQEEYIMLFQNPEVRALGRRWYEHPAFENNPSFGEGMERIQTEADRFLAGFEYEHDLERNVYISRGGNTENIGFFAHWGFGMMFLSCILDIPYPMFVTHFDLHVSRVNVIEFSEKEGIVVPTMMQFGGDSHLFRDGLPCEY